MLPNIDELRNIAKLSNAAVIGISESKLDDSVISSELHINNYNLLRCDRNILGDFNINLKNSYIFQKNNLLQSQSIPGDIKKYYKFCTMFGLKQLIEVPARVTCSSSTIIDHILASFPNRVSQQGAINVGLSDHQIVYCTRCTKSPESKDVRTRKLDAVR